MQPFKGRYLQVYSATRTYGDDLRALGRDTVQQLLEHLHPAPSALDPLIPRLAVVLFTQPRLDPDETQPRDARENASNHPTSALRQLAIGIDESLSHYGNGHAVPVIGCSVASIPDMETRQIHKHAVSITILAARKRDFTARVAGSPGYTDDEIGHEKAWDACLYQIEEKDAAAVPGDEIPPDESFVLAFFPGLTGAENNFRSRNLASYQYLRSKVGAAPHIFGAGAGELGPERRCEVMAGAEIIEGGYACARVRTTLRFEMSMDHNLQMADEALQVRKVDENDPTSIVSFAVPPDYDTVPAGEVYKRLRERYRRFAFHVLDFRGGSEQLSFVSFVSSRADALKLVRPIKENTPMRPAFVDKNKPLFNREAAERLAEDTPVGVVFFLACQGMYRLLGDEEEDRDQIVLEQIQRMAIHPRSPSYCAIAAFVFGEWGVGQDLNGQAQYYHTTTLALADGLTPRDHQRRQLEVIDRCSKNMSERLLAAEDQFNQRLPMRHAVTVLGNTLFEAMEDLGYEGGLISLVDEIDQNIIGTIAQGPAWNRLRTATVVRLDEQDLLARVYRGAGEKHAERHIADCRREPLCAREMSEGIVSQTVLPLWDGRRCLGILQVGHSVLRTELPDYERNALFAIARTAALHLSRIKNQETVRDLEAAVRVAIASDDQEKGWCHLARVAARAVEVPFCTIRILDRNRGSLKLVGGTQELFELTRNHHRKYTDIVSGSGPVVEWFRQQEARGSHQERDPHVINDTATDPDMGAIIQTSPPLADFYGRIRSYTLGPIVLPERRLIGVISFLDLRRDTFNAKRVELVRRIADFASLIAGAYTSVQLMQSLLQTTSSLTTIQEQVDTRLRSAIDINEDSQAAAQLFVDELVRIFPCEACTLHRFKEGRYLELFAAAPDPDIHRKKVWDVLASDDRGLLLHLASQRETFRAAGKALRDHPRIHIKSGVWNWLPKTRKLHSILAIPLANPDGRHYGLLTLYNRLNEEGMPNDAVDFSDVHTQVRVSVQEIATYILESLESRSGLARLTNLADSLHSRVNEYARSTPPVSSGTVISEIAESIAAWLEGEMCSIYLIEPAERHLVLKGCFGWKSGERMVNHAMYKVGEGLTGALAESADPEVIPSIFADPRRTRKYFDEMYGAEDPLFTYEMIALPLPFDQQGRPTGIITVHRKLPSDFALLLRFSEQDGSALILASRLAAFAISGITGSFVQQDAANDLKRPAIADILNFVAGERLRSLDYSELSQQIARYFDAETCGIFLSDRNDDNVITLTGASGDLHRYVGKIRVAKYDGPVGEAFGLATTRLRATAEECAYVGQLDGPLRDVLQAPPRNLMAVPMRLGEACGGVILLVNQSAPLSNEERRGLLRKYNVEALGTGILLVQRYIDQAVMTKAYEETIAEHRHIAVLMAETLELAHDAGKQLGGIAGALDMIRHPDAPEARKERELNSIQTSYQNFANTVAQLVATVGHSGTSEPVDVVDIVRAALERNNTQAEERGVRIENRVRASTLVQGPRTQLVNVIASIVANAIEACPEVGGEISVDLQHRPGDRIRIAVSDNGPGVADEDFPFLFIKGFSTRSEAFGTARGYGLNIAKIILLSKGGDLQIENRPEGGARATVWLHEERANA